MSVQEALADALELLRRALDRARLYGVGHPEARAVIDDVWSSLQRAILAGAPLTLSTGMDGISWKGQLLLEEDEDRESLGRQLHREGIASLTFHGSFSRAELDKLLGVLRINLSLPEFEEETLDALLWQSRIEGLGFKVVAELMEAEAISGDAVRYLQERGHSRIDAILGEDGSVRAQRKRLVVPEDALIRAIEAAQAEADGQELDLDREAEDELWQVDAEADQEWEHRFTQAEDADAETVARLRAGVVGELPGDQIRRVCRLLFRVSRANRDELPPDQAIALVRSSVDEILRQHDTFALVQLVTEARQALQQEPDPDRKARIADILEIATQPTLIARLLAAAGPTADPAATQQLVEMLDDAAIQALIEWSFPAGEEEDEATVERSRWLAEALGESTARRARRWLTDPQAPPRLLVPAARLLHGRDRPEDRALRPELLGHPAARVQELVMAWYAETGVPEDELALLLARLEDRRPRVRRATWPLLASQQPEDLPRWFRTRLNPRVLDERPEDLQQDLCIACGRILGRRALPMLEQLLERQVGLFAGKGQGRLLLAAALGIAAVGTPQSRAVLDRGSRSWVGVRSQACKEALARLDSGRIP